MKAKVWVSALTAVVLCASAVVTLSAGDGRQPSLSNNTGADPKPRTDDKRWVSALMSCVTGNSGRSGEAVTCVTEVADSAIRARQVGSFLEAVSNVSNEHGEVFEVCNAAVAPVAPRALTNYSSFDAMIADTNALGCGVSFQQHLMVAYASDPEADWRTMVAACAADIGNVPNGHTAACAKGIGWGLRAWTAEHRPTELSNANLLETCKTLFSEHRDPGTAGDIEYDRVFYGCANGAIISAHVTEGSTTRATRSATLTSTADDCITLLRSQTPVDDLVLALVNGCAGGLGAAMGTRLRVLSAEPNEAEFMETLDSSLEICSRITDATLEAGIAAVAEAGLVFGSECHAQTFRQTAYRLFGSERLAASSESKDEAVDVTELCTRIRERHGELVASVCSREHSMFTGS